MNKLPTTRKFGVEIEFSGISQNVAIEAIRQSGVDAERQSYNHTTCARWKVITDSSCGLEAVSPVLEGEDGLRQIEKVCQALSNAGARVRRNCGYHVHLDVADFEMRHFKNLVKLWVKFEDVFDTFQPPSRRSDGNQYCRSNLARFGHLDNGQSQAHCCREAFEAIDRCQSVEELARVYGSRFHKLNVQAYFRHRTIEVRHHAGTLCPKKAVNWVLLMMELYDTAKRAKTVKARPSSDEMGMTRHKWFFQRTADKSLKQFYTKRARSLQRLAA